MRFPDGSLKSERTREILRRAISTFVMTGRPVGSRMVARHIREDLSPATVRNIMAELEDLALRHIDPEAYQELTERIAQKRQERQGEMSALMQILKAKLQEVDVQAQITGRPKHFYSIYKKMRDQ